MLNKNEIVTIAGGHVGHAGAYYYGKREEVLAYEISKKLVSMFNEKGYKAYEVSPQGTGYTENSQLRAEVTNANRYNAKLHLCIHFNASEKHDGFGTETWIYALGGTAEKYAKTICSELAASLNLRNRGVKVSGNNLYVPRATKAPCCLVEVCFLDFQADMAKYNIDKTCRAIFKATTGIDYNGATIEPIKDDTSNSTSNESNNTITNTNSTTECIQGYNAIIKNDWFYLRDSSGTKTGSKIEIGTKIKVLDVSYSKQLVYIAYLENNVEKKAYITNATNCIEYLYSNQWSNGSTKEIVYETSSCKNSIGELSAREKATPLYRENGVLHVVYTTSKGINTKSGYVKYNGGFAKL